MTTNASNPAGGAGSHPGASPQGARLTPPIDRGHRADIRVLVVDGQPLSRSGLSSLVRNAGLDVVGETGDMARAAAIARLLTPDVALMDLDLLGMSGVEAVCLMSSSSPARVLTIISAAPQEAISTLAAGAFGCILRDDTPSQVVAAIRAAAGGELVLSPSIATRLVERLRPQTVNASRDSPTLSPREAEVLDLLTRGWDNARIAAALYVSVGTVKHHISNILSKLGVENRIQAAVRAVRDGLLDGQARGGRS
jgi:DNA-binding NarL/FixJ family response regulator